MRVKWSYRLHYTGILRDRPLLTVIVRLSYRRFFATVPKSSGMIHSKRGHLLPYYTDLFSLCSTRPGLVDGGGVIGGGDVGPAVGADAQLAGGRRCRAGGLARASPGARASWPNTHC